MSKIEKAVQQMEKWARDDSHGYDQIYRWGEKGDYDCSSAIIQACENAGIPVKSKGATYTGNMLPVFQKCNFQDVTSKINLSTGEGLKRGDVLLNISYHTAMYCGDGKEVESSINEKGTVTGGKPGDQTGREFLIRSYRNYPWDHVLRYQEEASGGGAGTNPDEKIIYTVAYAARIIKDTKCYLGAGVNSGQAKLFSAVKKDALVDVMQYTQKDSAGKTWHLIRLAHPTEGFVLEFVPSGCFEKII